MIKLFSLGGLFAVTMQFILLASCSSRQKHIGEWKGTDEEGTTMNIIFQSNSNCLLISGNKVSGGKQFLIGNKKEECKYEIDYSKDPIWLDVIIKQVGEIAEDEHYRGIARFITNDKLEWRVNWDGDRFKEFDPNDRKHTILLSKVKGELD